MDSTQTEVPEPLETPDLTINGMRVADYFIVVVDPPRKETVSGIELIEDLTPDAPKRGTIVLAPWGDGLNRRALIRPFCGFTFEQNGIEYLACRDGDILVFLTE